MSDASRGPGWWLASDGRWYPPQPVVAPPPPPPPPPSPAPPGAGAPYGVSAPLPGPSLRPGYAVFVQVAFAVTAAMYAFMAVLVNDARSTFARYWNAAFPDEDLWRAAIEADERLTDFGPILLACNLTLLLVTIVWMWQAHRAAERLRPGDRRWERGWTIGGWFIPLGNLFIPKRVMNETERLATAPRAGGVAAPGWRESSTSGVGWAWWLLFVAGWLGIQLANNMIDTAVEELDGDAVISGYGIGLGAVGLSLVAAVCAAVYVGKVSRRLSPAAIDAADGAGPLAAP